MIQSDVYRNIDFLTGVTLNEGLYFAEYHIAHFFSNINNRSSPERPEIKQEPLMSSNSTAMIPPDIVQRQDNLNDKRKYNRNRNESDFEDK